MEPDKRRFVRKRTDQLLYAELGPDNGSILLNLSEEGCSFQSIAPVRGEQVRFTVSVGDGCKLEGDGQMIWSDTVKKTGGLRFLNPSQELREQIREWLEQTLVTADGKLDPAAVDSEAKRRRQKLREEAKAAAKLARKQGARQTPNLEPGQVETQAQKGHAQMSAARVQVISGAETANDSTSRVTHGNPLGKWGRLGRIGLLAMLCVAVVSYRRELGHLLMSFGSSMAGDEQKGGTGAPAEVQPVPENVGAEAKPAALSDRMDTPRESAAGGEAGAISSEQIAPSTNVSTVPVKRNAAQPASTSEDVSSLWTSVENGDTHAEVALANRYVRGEGVPQSCAQARVLLEAAVKRGSTEAQQKLDELTQGGCP